jgi:hypothetical protein
MMYLWQYLIILAIVISIWLWLEHRATEHQRKAQRMAKERKKWLRYLKEKNDAGTD